MEPFPFSLSKGKPLPLGSSSLDEGVNFAIASTKAKTMSLVLFSPQDPNKVLYEIPLNSKEHRTGSVWHICLQGLQQPLLYLFQVNQKMPNVLDPYAKEVFTTNEWGQGGKDPRPYHPMGIVNPSSTFDWENVASPNLPLEDLLIYEMHVRGFTKHSSSGVKSPGTFLGMIEKIPYLKELGVNALELLPVFEFNECDNPHINPTKKTPLCNYWGYSTVNFFSPMQRFASKNELGVVLTEFKMLVKELHRNGIELFLDVVYNHTAEGNSKGPVLSFRGIDDAVYYMHDPHGKYLDFTGCGNTVNCNHAVVTKLIVNSLRYWVTEMHVDGFRFDLASVFMRDPQGKPVEMAPVIQAITHDPILSNVKLIAEPWDVGGLYQVGSFPEGQRWMEWNGRYRDTMRRFIKGTGNKGDFVTRLCGSQDLYQQHSPARSVNFITAHDGFTLQDLVSYNHKHNLENGENNRDGLNENDSWNCGVEGETTDQKVITLRERQKRNFHVALMLSRGIPMVHMGDEYCHTKQGNNNTWCQDNDLNWFLWNRLENNPGFTRFYKLMIQFRKQHPVLRQNKFFSQDEIHWHGSKMNQPEWDKQNHFIAYVVDNLYVAFNSSNATVSVELPPAKENCSWHFVVNTGNKPPDDFYDETSRPKVTVPKHQMAPHSAIVLECT